MRMFGQCWVVMDSAQELVWAILNSYFYLRYWSCFGLMMKLSLAWIFSICYVRSDNMYITAKTFYVAQKIRLDTFVSQIDVKWLLDFKLFVCIHQPLILLLQLHFIGPFVVPSILFYSLTIFLPSSVNPMHTWFWNCSWAADNHTSYLLSFVYSL